jgi:hypothetical protein
MEQQKTCQIEIKPGKDVAAYIWPAYTGNEHRTKMFWPEGIGEWETVKKAKAKFPGHSWPRRPVWGYVNEADPYVMEMEIQAAADHNVNVFIYDWYWYDGRPFLENCLNDGYLKASNNHKVRFYLMWANHDVNNLWDLRLSHNIEENIIWRAGVGKGEFERICHRLINNYFHHPSYYCIDSKPVFMLYDLQTFIDGIGGLSAATTALELFREIAVRSGLPGLHLQASLRNNTCNISGVDTSIQESQESVIDRIGFDSISHYQFVHFTDIDREYKDIMHDVENEWKQIDQNYKIPYIPHISVGWDNNPRFKEFHSGIVRGNTPDQFAEGLKKAHNYLEKRPHQPQLITINSWNEWTETSYLQPDNLYGYGYLEAVKKVFSGH